MLADSHCHLQMGEGAAELLARARAAGVTRFLVPGTTLADSEAAAAMADPSAGIFAAVGIHPHEAKDFDALPRRRAVRGARGAARRRRDRRDRPRLPLRPLAARRSRSRSSSGCSTARRRLGLPAILHNRQSGAEMLALLRRLAGARGRRRLPLVHGGRGLRPRGDRPRLPRVLLRDDHVPRRREHPLGGGRPAARGDARRDRHALSRPGAAPRQALRARVRGRDGEEARRGQGNGPRSASPPRRPRISTGSSPSRP